MSSKFVADFEPAGKLKDPEAPLPYSRTKYEKYLEDKDTRTRTKGNFEVDPQRLAAVKHSAQF